MAYHKAKEYTSEHKKYLIKWVSNGHHEASIVEAVNLEEAIMTLSDYTHDIKYNGLPFGFSNIEDIKVIKEIPGELE